MAKRIITKPEELALQLAEEPTIEQLALSTITKDSELCCRARGVDPQVVKEYAEVLESAELPPITVFRDATGKNWLVDGYHRAAAHESLGHETIAVEVRAGSRRDGLLFAVRANERHGLRRTNADKNRGVRLLLAAWPRWSDRRLAEACGVSHPFVAAVRADMETVTTSTEARVGADGKARRTPKAKQEADADHVAANARAVQPIAAELAALEAELERLVATAPEANRQEIAAMLTRWATRLVEATAVPSATNSPTNPAKPGKGATSSEGAA